MTRIIGRDSPQIQTSCFKAVKTNMLLCRCYCVNFMLKESTINWFSSSIIVSYFDLGEDDIILMLSPDTVTPCGGKRYNRK